MSISYAKVYVHFGTKENSQITATHSLPSQGGKDFCTVRR